MAMPSGESMWSTTVGVPKIISGNSSWDPKSLEKQKKSTLQYPLRCTPVVFCITSIYSFFIVDDLRWKVGKVGKVWGPIRKGWQLWKLGHLQQCAGVAINVKMEMKIPPAASPVFAPDWQLLIFLFSFVICFCLYFCYSYTIVYRIVISFSYYEL